MCIVKKDLGYLGYFGVGSDGVNTGLGYFNVGSNGVNTGLGYIGVGSDVTV